MRKNSVKPLFFTLALTLSLNYWSTKNWKEISTNNNFIHFWHNLTADDTNYYAVKLEGTENLVLAVDVCCLVWILLGLSVTNSQWCSKSTLIRKNHWNLKHYGKFLKPKTFIFIDLKLATLLGLPQSWWGVAGSRVQFCEVFY